MYYIQEADKPNFIFKMASVIQLKQDKIILPITGDAMLKSWQAQRLSKKTQNILKEAISQKIVISNKIKKQEEYVNLLHTYHLTILQGRWLMEVLSPEILDYILQQKQMKKEETLLSILVNDLTQITLANLRNIVKDYKSVNIITNHREKFKKIEKQILEEDGIMITVGSNKKKGLTKSQIILNVDFPTELINQYTLKEDAIVVNIRQNVKIHKKRFNGITINDFAISFESSDGFDYDKNTKYESSEIYEAQISQRQPYEEIRKQIKKDKVKIVKLKGKNEEF